MLKTSSNLRIVLVQENENDRLLFRRAFQKSDVSCEISDFSRAEEALEQLGADASSFDVVAVDHNLPGISGMDLCRKLLDKKIPPPLVLLAETGSEQLVAEALMAGVHDYIIKDPKGGYLELLPMSLINIARRHVDHYSYKQAEKTLQDSEKAAGAFLDAIPDTAVLIDTEGNILVMNKAGADRMGRSLDEIIGKNVRDLFPEDVYELRQSKVMEVIRTGNMVSYEDERDGICFDTCMCPVFDAQGKVERLAIFARDITARKHLENELAMYAAFPHQNPNPVLRISRDGLILNANRASGPILRTWGIELGQCVPQASRKRMQETLNKGEVSSWEFTCHDGRIFLFTLAPVHDNGYLNLYGMDVTEHQKAQEVLKQSEEKFRLAMETTNDALWDWNVVTNEVYRNPRHATMLGYEPQELSASQEDWEKLIHPDDRQAVFQIRDEHLTGKRDSFEIEYRLRTKSDDYVWVLGRGKIVTYNDDGSPARMIGTNIDITDRKKLHDRDEIILKTCIDGFWLIDTHGRILETNDAYCRMSGYSRNELLTMSVQDVEAVETPQETLQHIQGIVDKGHHRFESSHRRKDGTIMDLDISTHYLELDGGRQFTFFRDITATKQAENTLRESEARYRTLVEQLPAVTYMASLDEASTTLYISPQIEDLIGFTAEENKSDPDIWRKQLHPNDRDRVLRTVSRSHAEKKPFAEEYRMIAKNGSVVWFRDEAVIVKDEKNQPLFLQGVMYNITERKQAEEEIRKFKTISDKAGHGVAIVDLEGNLVYVNDSFAQMHQYSIDELIGKNLSIFHNEDQIERVSQLNDQLKQKGSYVAEEVWHKKRDNTVFPTLMSATLVRDEAGEPLYMAATAIDMTKHKKAEEALQESELRYRTLFETLPVGVGLSASDGRIIDGNSTFQRMIGYSIEEARRINVLDTYYNTAERAPLLKQLQQDGFVRGVEVQLKRKDGTIFLASLNVTTMRMRDETVFVTVARDITEHRRLERALAENEEKYRTLVEGAGDPISTVDERGVFLFANKVAAETLGYQPEDLVGKTLWDFFPKKMADQSAANIRKVIETGQKINTVSLREVQGQTRWYSATIEPIRDDHGSVTAAMVIVRDIDDMKRAEEQIKKLSSAVESSINGIAIGDAEGNLTYVNHAFLEMWGYDHENEVLGRNVIELWEMRDEAENVLNTLRDRNGWIGELAARKKDGSRMNVQVCVTLVTDENDRPISIMGSFVDITESKRREEELSKYRGQMARAEQLASLGTLSATIAHQLTQPLTVIRLSMDNALDELEATSSSETVIRRLKDSVTQVSNITSIIGNFRNFARKSSGKTVAEVNLKTVAVRIAMLLSESARSANIVLRVRDMGELPCPWMNETDLEQLFFALIENSIQAADGKKTRQLLISGVLKDKHIELRLSDDCGGIAPENLDKIFEPFFTTKPRGQGTGLGLCIVQDVVSRIGGHVQIESEFGKGTTFIISMPVN
ncbi:MAG: PAS domain S-box protein [Sedimentisphaerales bacterium]